ncbi:MAG: transglutaminaseTgpA domain-containing protein, partial [Planctomycetia bacterium]
MDLRSLHLLSTYALLCLGTTGLWMGEADTASPYPLVVVACAAAAYVFTDKARLVRMPHFVSNTLGVVILSTISFEFFRDAASTVLALAHFLVYLQVVKFFRDKTESDLWLLYVVNVLQIAIACVVNQRLSFGLVLLAYSLLGVVTLFLFYLRRHEATVHRSGAPAAACPTGFDDPATFGAPAVPAVAGATVRW